MTVVCTNPTCPEHGIAKAFGFPAEAIAECRCGACGGPVEAGPDTDDEDT